MQWQIMRMSQKEKTNIENLLRKPHIEGNKFSLIRKSNKPVQLVSNVGANIFLYENNNTRKGEKDVERYSFCL